MTEQFHKIPIDLWLEIASHFSSANEPRSGLNHTPWHLHSFPSAKVDHNLVNLSSSCRFLRQVLRDEVISYLCLNLIMVDGQLLHIAWSNQRELTYDIGRYYTLDMIPTGPHIRRLYLHTQVMLDRNPRKLNILDKVPGLFGEYIRRAQNRIQPPSKLAKFDISVNYGISKTQVMEWASPVLDAMPNIQTLQLQPFVTSFITGRSCDIGPRCMAALARLKSLENLHLGRSLRVPEYHESLPVVRLTIAGDAPSFLPTFPYLKNLCRRSDGYPHNTLPLETFMQLEVLHWDLFNETHVYAFHESCLALSRTVPQPKSALRELVIDARLQEEHVLAIIKALAFASLTTFVCYDGKWRNVRGHPHPHTSDVRELATLTWPGLTTCLIGNDINDIMWE